MIPDPIPKFLTVREVAELLRLHVSSVRAAIERGEIPALRLGHKFRISSEALLKIGLPMNDGVQNGKTIAHHR